MSVGKPERSYRHLFTMFDCPCGRTLRVKVELAGTEVRCWDCHQMVKVPIPRNRSEIVRMLRAGAGEVFQLSPFLYIALAASLFSAAFLVPRFGIALAAFFLIIASYGYGELIRWESFADVDEDEPQDVPIDRRDLVRRGASALVLGLFLAAPWLLKGRGFDHPVRITPLGFGLSAVAAVALPLVLLFALARDKSRPIGPRRLLTVLGEHPVALIAAIVIAPLGALAAEFVIFLLLRQLGWLPFMLLDLFPDPRGLCRALNISFFYDYYHDGLAEPKLIRMYGRLLRHGYTLVGALPVSLPKPQNVYTLHWSLGLSYKFYIFFRLVLTFLGAMIFFLALSIQARWLGMLAGLEPCRHPARS